MKIGVVHVTAEEVSRPYTKLITANLDRAKRDDTEIVHRYVAHMRRATDTAIAYPTLLNSVDVVAEMVKLEQEDGCDAVMVACSGDPGVHEARSLLKIPVVGPMEAGMALATGYGWKFGILTVADSTWGSNMDQMVHRYGFASRYAGQRQLLLPTKVIFTEGFEKPEMVREDIIGRARELVGDGADVILIGTAGISTFASSFGIAKADDPEVPIFDVISIGLKFAELRADVQQQMGIPPVSRAGWYGEFSAEDRQRVDKLFGWTVDTAGVPS
jgi:Asp/Glu/hydantoin racemase